MYSFSFSFFLIVTEIEPSCDNVCDNCACAQSALNKCAQHQFHQFQCSTLRSCLHSIRQCTASKQALSLFVLYPPGSQRNRNKVYHGFLFFSVVDDDVKLLLMTTTTTTTTTKTQFHLWQCALVCTDVGEQWPKERKRKGIKRKGTTRQTDERKVGMNEDARGTTFCRTPQKQKFGTVVLALVVGNSANSITSAVSEKAKTSKTFVSFFSSSSSSSIVRAPPWQQFSSRLQQLQFPTSNEKMPI